MWFSVALASPSPWVSERHSEVQPPHTQPEFNSQSIYKVMTPGGPISAVIRTNHTVSEENEVKKIQFYAIQYLLSKRTWPKWIHPLSAQISRRFQTWKLKLQHSCSHWGILWLIRYPSGCRYRAFHHAPEEFLVLLLPWQIYSEVGYEPLR